MADFWGALLSFAGPALTRGGQAYSETKQRNTMLKRDKEKTMYARLMDMLQMQQQQKHYGQEQSNWQELFDFNKTKWGEQLTRDEQEALAAAQRHTESMGLQRDQLAEMTRYHTGTLDVSRDKAATTDPMIALNRWLEGRGKAQKSIYDMIDYQRNRAGGQLEPYVAGQEGAYEQLAPTIGSTVRGGFLGLGGREPNPAYGPAQNYLFWNPANPQAFDSAAALTGLKPLWNKLYANEPSGAMPSDTTFGGAPSPPVSDTTRGSTVLSPGEVESQLKAQYGEEWNALPDSTRQAIIALKMYEGF